MVKVMATARGFYGGARREPGEFFEAEGEASWFTPVEGEPVAEAEPAAEAPEPAKGKRGGKKAEPFAEAPEPETVAGNGVKAELGDAPDWVQPI